MLDAKKIRHQLHQHPEISGQEVWTTTFIAKQLRKLGISKIYTGFSQQSIVAEIDSQQPGLTLLFRCELDALPIQETNTFTHKSTKKGISHKCGHDGHCATMLAFAQKLILNPPQSGKILLLFQSAEETGTGAKSVIDSNFFQTYAIDYAFAYHNLPSFPLGAVLCKAGIFTPSVESFSIKLFGKSCHASQPTNGTNPATAVAQIIQFMDHLHQPNKANSEYFIVSPIHINMGDKTYGITAGEAEIGYTIRTWEKPILEQFKQKITQKVDKICREQTLTYSIAWLESFTSNNNDLQAFEHICNAATQSDLKCYELETPLDFGEDFGLFTEMYKGAMFAIGAGEGCPALHTVDYDFPDELIEIGSKLFYQLSQIQK